MRPLTASRVSGAGMWLAILGGAALVFVAVHDATQVVLPGRNAIIVVNLLVVCYLVWQFVFSGLESVRAKRAVGRGHAVHAKPGTSRRETRGNAEPGDGALAKFAVGLELDRLSVVALVPVYNEDPEALRRCLESMTVQTRPIQAICVTDDGSTTSDYAEVRRWAVERAAQAGIRLHWVRQANGGKRSAQMAGVRREPAADAYLTVDSDSILDPGALAAMIKRFADAQVQSVAAVILTTNYAKNLLTRMVDVYCVSLQLFERSALSAQGSVLVNCGGCALYRGDILRDNAHTYLSETLLGRHVTMSDDSLLTLFAAKRGLTVQEPSAFAFTLMPETFSHHRRQQLRWMRGSFIRSGWRLKYLPLARPAYWLHLAKWIQYALVTGVFIALLASGLALDPRLWLAGVLASVGIYTLIASRYLTVRRCDQSVGQRWLVFLTAPLAALWSLTVLRVLRWYAMATFIKVGWGTRSTVEVAA